jgi:hypothetical protein
MKGFLLLIVFTLFVIRINANNNDTIKVDQSEWAITLSYPSYFGILLEADLSKDYVYYPAGISISLDWKREPARTQLSPGVIYRTKNIKHDNGLNEKLSMTELPIKVKYYFIINEPEIDLFLTSALSLCRLESRISGDLNEPVLFPEPVIFPRHRIDYLPIINAGFGSDFRLSKSIGLVIESKFGYGLTHVLPNRASIELFVGLRLKI